MGLSQRGENATPVVLFEYQAGRGQQHPQAFLRGVTGTLMTDGYCAWRTLDGVRHLGCFAHARRYFDEAAKAQRKADGRARQALDLIGRLYQVEALAKGNLPDWRSRADYTFALRQQHSLPVLAALESWLDWHAETVLPKHAGQASDEQLLQGSVLSAIRRPEPSCGKRSLGRSLGRLAGRALVHRLRERSALDASCRADLRSSGRRRFLNPGSFVAAVVC